MSHVINCGVCHVANQLLHIFAPSVPGTWALLKGQYYPSLGSGAEGRTNKTKAEPKKVHTPQVIGPSPSVME